jgi:hypothetical protein
MRNPTVIVPAATAPQIYAPRVTPRAVVPSEALVTRQVPVPVPVTPQMPQTASKVRAAVGSKLPSMELDFGFPPEKVNIAERSKGKRLFLVGLPGAFTPT